ncbi:CaiB/BaiF CoA transferase family protein [Chloroflexota bacterium]
MKPALEGVKVLDFTWVVVGPLATEILAQYGAEVIRIESMQRMDQSRAAPPFKDQMALPDTSGLFAMYNANKQSLSVNLKDPKGIDVAKRLIGWADIMVDNFRPGQMARWGLDYENARQINPQIIAISSSALGQTGPHAQRPGYGQLLGSLCGFNFITGWPDREPIELYAAYVDFVAGPFIAATAVAALDYRQRTGQGVFVDLAQNEAALHFMTPLILDYSANKRVMQRVGNRCSYAAPHGAYRCRGEDRWCVIAVYTDTEWEDFCNVVGNPQLVQDPKFATLLDRKRNEDELDSLIQIWTSNFAAEEVEMKLQSVGIEALLVKNPQDSIDDLQFEHREHFVWHNHPVIGRYFYCQPGFRLNKTPSQNRSPSPALGQDTESICREGLGMSDKEFIELADKVFFTDV